MGRDPNMSGPVTGFYDPEGDYQDHYSSSSYEESNSDRERRLEKERQEKEQRLEKEIEKQEWDRQITWLKSLSVEEFEVFMRQQQVACENNVKNGVISKIDSDKILCYLRNIYKWHKEDEEKEKHITPSFNFVMLLKYFISGRDPHYVKYSSLGLHNPMDENEFRKKYYGTQNMQRIEIILKRSYRLLFFAIVILVWGAFYKIGNMFFDEKIGVAYFTLGTSIFFVLTLWRRMCK